MASQPRVSVLEELVESRDHQRLFVRSWRADRDMRAALAIVHGFNSHSGYYERFASDVSMCGIAAYALDLRGRGKSSGARFDVRRFAEFGNDVDTLLSTIREQQPSRPLFMLGQGAGAVVACLSALAHQQNLAGLICASIALEPFAHAAFLQVVKALAALTPRLPALRLRNERLSRDSLSVARMNMDPLIAGERQSARTIAEMLRANDRLRAAASRLSLPLLVLHGSADKVTRLSGSEYLHERAGSLDKTLQIFEGYYHDLINDQGHELVVERICQWIDARQSATAQRLQIGIEYINSGHD